MNRWHKAVRDAGNKPLLGAALAGEEMPKAGEVRTQRRRPKWAKRE